MATLIRDFGNANNWSDPEVVTFGAVKLPNGTYARIPRQYYPFSLDRFIVAVKATSFTAKENWHNAGYANILYHSGLDLDGLNMTSINYGYRLTKDVWQVIEVPQFAGEYVLQFAAPPWYHDMSWYISFYSGIATDSTEQSLTANIEPALVRIQNNLDIVIPQTNN